MLQLESTWLSEGNDRGKLSYGRLATGLAVLVYRCEDTGDWRRIVQEGRWTLLDDEHMLEYPDTGRHPLNGSRQALSVSFR
jgi:hypothetical protein